ncbi:hypothetical protein [Pseudotabrizicola alkalilacus]|uniref:Uncharacterized protein n=1 Tax=Pseudotabrizicola alkalilacus TaxID=2305252 RepID=A0A411Z241_9RHOB|nr:hypothetical protein [Pseudotabrizicola alkalilacus]RGP37127.1 hypothetical protein D1012_10700 [Pseudotabrizicola alkalilacus]
MIQIMNRDAACAQEQGQISPSRSFRLRDDSRSPFRRSSFHPDCDEHREPDPAGLLCRENNDDADVIEARQQLRLDWTLMHDETPVCLIGIAQGVERLGCHLSGARVGMKTLRARSRKHREEVFCDLARCAFAQNSHFGSCIGGPTKSNMRSNERTTYSLNGWLVLCVSPQGLDFAGVLMVL